MKKLRNLTRFLFVWIGIAFTSILIGILLFLFFSRFLLPDLDPPLIVNLFGTNEQMTEKFDRRVRELFPAGTSEKALMEELARQGFENTTKATLTDGEKLAIRRGQKSFVCDIWARVFWTADTAGTLQSIRGTYLMGPCI